jgi:3-deoxy-D-manno-octulosonic-acid transferase
LYTCYRLLIGVVFYSLLPFLLAFVLISGRHREGLGQRFALYPAVPGTGGRPRIWLHAASVGEVQAARAIIAELRSLLPQAEFTLTTMTLHGRKVAERLLAPDVVCLLAPLDVPGVVGRALRKLAPDAYVCIETELWPLLLQEASCRGVRVVQVNGRLSARAAGRYRRSGGFFRQVLANFTAMAVISEADRDRYLALGAIASRLQVLGNVKFDLRLPDEPDRVRAGLRQDLGIGEGLDVLVAGSTHSGEEELLAPLFQRLTAEGSWLVVVAPRHMERLEELTAMYEARGIAFDLFSRLRSGERRRHAVVILDSLGELADIYAVATYVFCGGSLVPRNGHNIMEAAIWDKAVFYGSSMADFQDAVQILEAADAGFMVRDTAELAERLQAFRKDPEAYRQACRRAGEAARAQLGAARKQAAMIINGLTL